MTRLRAIIVDDEPLSRRAMRQLLEAHGEVDVVAEYADAVGWDPSIRSADVVFLDVEMPQRSGLDVARSWPPGPPWVVFVTAFDRYAHPAFDTEALDYLTKPVSADRLARALVRVQERMTTWREGQPAAGARLMVRVGDRELFLDPDTIDAIEADGVYAAVALGGRRHLVRRSLDDLERTLPSAAFLRVHRSWIVRVEAVVRTEPSASEGLRQLVLRSGLVVPISRRRQAQVLRALRQHG